MDALPLLRGNWLLRGKATRLLSPRQWGWNPGLWIPVQVLVRVPPAIHGSVFLVETSVSLHSASMSVLLLSNLSVFLCSFLSCPHFKEKLSVVSKDNLV